MADGEGCDVAIIGAGPVGLFLANLLGLAGRRVVLLERHPGLSTLPRAIAFDDETLRSLAQIGLLAAVRPGLIEPETVRFLNARQQVLMEMNEPRTITGQPALATFHQPSFEAILLSGTQRFPTVRLIFNATVTEAAQDADAATVVFTAAHGGQSLRARYLVACDGGASATRAWIGAHLEGATYPQKWLVIDAAVSGHQVRGITFGCDPQRPSVQVPAVGDRLRWEFLQLPGETEADLLADETIARFLAPYGYGARLRLERKAVYTFHTRIASRWRDRRIFLAGDAAHLMPPFAGQGMNSGFRDAANLAWKLDHALRGLADDAVLASYEAERKAQVAGVIALSARLGSVIMPLSHRVAALRDAVFFCANRIPPVRRLIARGEFRPPTRLAPSLLADRKRDSIAGTILPHAVPAPGSIALDEIWGCHDWLVLGVGGDPQAGLSAAIAAKLSALRAIFVMVNGTPTCAGTQAVQTADPIFLAWVRRHTVRGVVVRPDRFILGRLGNAACAKALSLFARQISTVQPQAESLAA